MTWLRTRAAISSACTGDGRPMTRSATQPDVELLHGAEDLEGLLAAIKTDLTEQ